MIPIARNITRLLHIVKVCSNSSIANLSEFRGVSGIWRGGLHPGIISTTPNPTYNRCMQHEEEEEESEHPEEEC